MSELRAVWKFPLGSNQARLDYPDPGEVVHVAFQFGNPTIWVEVAVNGEPKEHRFEVIATGKQFVRPDEEDELSIEHRGSCISPDSDFVFHVYELVRRDAA